MSSLSPTPVLDMLTERADDHTVRALFQDQLPAFLDDVSRVPILSIADEVSEFADAADMPFPQPEDVISEKGAWIEASTPMVAGGKLVPTGVLFDCFTPRGWSFAMLSARFVLHVETGVSPIAGRLLISPYNFGAAWHTMKEAITADVEFFTFADVERVRWGLQPAATASPAQLLQMQRRLVRKGDELLHALEDDGDTVFDRLPSGGLVADFGFEGLRLALARCSFRRSWLWEQPEPTSDLARHLFGNMVMRGPTVALNLLAIANKVVRGDLPSIALPEPFARGRKAAFVGKVAPSQVSGWELAGHALRAGPKG